MKTMGKILTAAAVGMAAGALTGLLLAPRSGKETRKLWRRKGERLADEIRYKIEDGREELSEIREKLERKLKDVNHKINQAV